MIALLCFFLTLFASPFKSRSLLRSPLQGIDHFHCIPFPKSISANHPKPQPRFEGAFFFGNFCKWRQGSLSSARSLKKIGWLRIVQEVIARQSRSQALIEFEPRGYLSVHVEFFKSII